MVRYSIGGKDYELALSLYAMERIEEELGDIRAAVAKFKGKQRDIKLTKTMFRILANAGRHARQLPEDVTGDELDNLGLKGLETLSQIMNQCMDDSMRSETVGGGEADDEVADVYAEQMAEREKNA